MKFLYETHMHTSESSRCAHNSAAEQVRAYKKMGYSGIIVTDHFINGNSVIHSKKIKSWESKMQTFAKGYFNAKKEGDKCGLDVFFGWEFSHYDADLLTYGLDYDFLLQNPDICELKPKAYSALIRNSGGYIAQAHPYRYIWDDDTEPYDYRLLDGVEVYNASMSDAVNGKARDFARLHNLAMQSGSDSHTVAPIHYQTHYGGIRLDKKAKSIFDIIDGIKTGTAELVLP